MAAIRGAMFDVSNWLLEIERMNQERQSVLDKDLESIDANDRPNEDEDAEGDDDEDEDEDDDEPPSFSELFGEAGGEQEDHLKHSAESHPSPVPPPSYQGTEGHHKTSKNLAHLHSKETKLNRTKLIFDAMVDQRNNNARWLGNNSKLTRLKFYGGLSTLLKLHVEWPQFDALWTKLDIRKSGDLDLEEFKKYFNLDGSNSEATDAFDGDLSAQSQHSLHVCLEDLCNQLRYAGFTVQDMFAGFDRDASGEISVAEFCSMLKLVLSAGAAKHIDKKLIYHALYAVDADGSKSVSFNELSKMIYTIWRMQLDELAERLTRLAATSSSSSNGKRDQDKDKAEKQVEQMLLKERNDIKEAIKRNFPRQMRDKLEAEAKASGHLHSLAGPFQSLYKRLGIHHGADDDQPNRPPEPIRQYPQSPLSKSRTTNPADNSWMGSERYPKPQSPQALKSSKNNYFNTGDDNHGDTLASSGKSRSHVNQMGRNQIKRFKIKVAVRPGMQLSMPPARELGNDTLMLGENTAVLLKESSTPYFG